MRLRSFHAAVVPLFVLASAAASSCIFFVDEAAEGAGAGGSGTGGAGTGGEGVSSSTVTSVSAGGGGGGAECIATVSAVGQPHSVVGLGASSELVLSVVPPIGDSSSAFVRLADGKIRRFSIVPGNGAPIQPWFEAGGLYPGARLSPASDDEVLVTHEGSVFKLVAETSELAQEPDLWAPGGDPVLPNAEEAVQVGSSVFVRAAEKVYRVTSTPEVLAGDLVDRLTANAQAPHWIYNANTVVSCIDTDCATANSSNFANPPPPFPVFTVRSADPPIIYLRTGGGADPAFIGPVGAGSLSSVDDQLPLATAVSAAFVGDHLVVVTESGDVHACCVDGVPACGPPMERGGGDRVAATPTGDRAVLAVGGALQLITVTEP